MIEELKKRLEDLDSLKEYLKSRQGPFLDKLSDYFYDLSTELGFDARKNAPLVKFGTNLGKLLCAAIKGDELVLAVATGYEGIKEGIGALFQLVESQARIGVLIISSHSPSSLTFTTVEALLRNPVFKYRRGEIMVIDIHSWRSRIYGPSRIPRKRIIGEREKEQD